jgi:hypothetical protein
VVLSKEEFVNAAKGLYALCQSVKNLKGRLTELDKAVEDGNLNTIRNTVNALKSDYEMIVNENDYIGE